MVNIMKKINLFFSVLVAFAIFSCNFGGGTDVDTANVDGMVFMGQQPSVAAKIFVMDVTYNPMLGDTLTPPQETVTDAEGHFQFSLEEGTYAIEVHDANGTDMAWKTNIQVKKGDAVDLEFTVKPWHVIIFPVPQDMIDSDFYIYIPGTNIYSEHLATDGQDYIPLIHTPQMDIPDVMMGHMDDMSAPAEMFHESVPMFMADTLDMR